MVTFSSSMLLILLLLPIVVVESFGPIQSHFVRQVLSSRANPTRSGIFAESTNKKKNNNDDNETNNETNNNNGDLFLMQMANNIKQNKESLLQEVAPKKKDIKSKMKQWAGNYNRKALQAKLQNRIDINPIFVLIYANCPYCQQVLSILEQQQQHTKKNHQEIVPIMKVVDLDSLVGLEKYAIRYEVMEMVDHTTIPALWIGGEFIGGAKELMQLLEQEQDGALLDAKLQQAIATTTANNNNAMLQE